MSSHNAPQSAPASPGAAPRVTVPRLSQMKQAGERIAMLTCYDASFAALMDGCGVDMLLIGDSLGMVVQGRDSTLAVTVEEVAYHTAAVARAARRAMVVADLPFGSYGTPEQAFQSAARLMQAGAQMVKLEGGAWAAPHVAFLVERGIPVCAHLGLTPQSVHLIGGYRVQGRSPEDAKRMLDDALALQRAGASLLVLEMVPSDVGASVTAALEMPTIGIGAGAGCSGQVLVMHDMLDVYPGRKPRFVRNFMDGRGSIADAIRAYVGAVKDGSFPEPSHGF